jgi:hypothetical protein
VQAIPETLLEIPLHAGILVDLDVDDPRLVLLHATLLVRELVKFLTMCVDMLFIP